MPQIALIIDTSSSQAFLAISHDGLIIKKIIIEDGRQLSKFLLPSIQSLLDGEKPTYLALGIGPGSFTGTRIGAVVIKTLSFALNLPTYTFSSSLLPNLEAIALACYEKSQKDPPESQIELVYFSPTP